MQQPWLIVIFFSLYFNIRVQKDMVESKQMNEQIFVHIFRQDTLDTGTDWNERINVRLVKFHLFFFPAKTEGNAIEKEEKAWAKGTYSKPYMPYIAYSMTCSSNASTHKMYI